MLRRGRDFWARLVAELERSGDRRQFAAKRVVKLVTLQKSTQDGFREHRCLSRVPRPVGARADICSSASKAIRHSVSATRIILAPTNFLQHDGACAERPRSSTSLSRPVGPIDFDPDPVGVVRECALDGAAPNAVTSRNL